MNEIYYLRWRRTEYKFSETDEKIFVIEIVTAVPEMRGFFTWIWHGGPMRGNETPFCFPGQP